jgi:hypothetical protein
VEIRNCRWSDLQGPAAFFARVAPACYVSSCFFQSNTSPSIPLLVPAARSAAGIVLRNVQGLPLTAQPPGLPAGIDAGTLQYGTIEIGDATTGV